jgi:predicted nucleic acid-binding protein
VLVREQVVPGRRVATSLVTYVEARAALARRRRAGDLTSAEYRRCVGDFTSDWERLVRVDVTEDLIHDAGRLAESHRLRGYDALHLASALALRGQVGESSMFASWDDDLTRAAGREGLTLLRTG